MPTMYDYILAQPQILSDILDRKDQILQDWSGLDGVKKIIFTGSGTSYHVAELAARWFRKAGYDASASFPIPLVHTGILDPAGIYGPGEILVVGISQSGTSTSTCRALEWAKGQGALTLSYSQDGDAALSRLADRFVRMPGQKELVPPETQGYTAALLGLYLAAGGDAEQARKMVNALPAVLETSEAWVQDHLEDFSSAGKLYFCGDDWNWITAQEAALKVGETSQRVTKPMEQEELAHFADLAFDENDHLFVLDHKDMEHTRTRELTAMAQGLTHHVWVVSDGLQDDSGLHLDLALPAELSPFVYVLPFQLMAALSAAHLGKDTSGFPHPEVENIAHDASYHLYQMKEKPL